MATKTYLIRLNPTTSLWLDVYDPERGHEWTSERKEAFRMPQPNADIRLEIVRKKFRQAVVETTVLPN